MRPPHRFAPVALAGLLTILAACSAGATPTPRPDCPTAPPSADEAAAINADAERATVVTDSGSFTIELDASTAPVAVANFVILSRCGFYDGITFHRIIDDFVIQAGDPQTKENRGDFAGLGTGGPGYRFEVEFPEPGTSYAAHVVAMANAIQYDRVSGEILGPTDSNGSQFFVTLDAIPGLRPYYSVLGTVVEGADVVDAIGAEPTSANDVPLQPIIIESIRIEAATSTE